VSITDVRVEVDVDVPMRDGCQLKADIYYPVTDEPAPALLMRLPYAKELAETNVYAHPAWFAARGYLVIVQDVRGRGASPGAFEPFLHEAEDGYDTVEWAASLPECSGRVAMYGFSYVGATQLLAASLRPPHLACIIPAHAAVNFYDKWTYRGGALQWAFVSYWAYFLSMDTAIRMNDLETAERISNGLAQVGMNFPTLPTSAFPAFPHELAPYFEEWLEHRTDDAYWKARGCSPSEITWETPAMHIAGWYDIFCDSTFETFAAMEALGVPQRLVVGPWWHMPWSPNLGIRDFGENAKSHASEWVLQWADMWCRNDEPPHDRASVEYFVLGDNTWRNADTWPPAEARPSSYFLESHGSANSVNGDGLLSLSPPDVSEPDRYIHNPLDPVPSRGGRSCCFSFVSPMGPADQSDVEARNDVLVFTTEQLDHPITLAGPVELVLYASSSAEDTDFTAKLVDVDPDGRTANICDGIIRASHRDGGDDAFIQPGHVYTFTVQLGHIAATFDVGHRIRLEVASSNFPAFDRSPGTRQAPSEAAWGDMRMAHQTVFHSAEFPSELRVWILED
jgi:putative CocE/NonD family hydrolase